MFSCREFWGCGLEDEIIFALPAEGKYVVVCPRVDLAVVDRGKERALRQLHNRVGLVVRAVMKVASSANTAASGVS